MLVTLQFNGIRVSIARVLVAKEDTKPLVFYEKSSTEEDEYSKGCVTDEKVEPEVKLKWEYMPT